MTRRFASALVAGVLITGAAACGGDADVPAVEESPTAAPGMDGQTQPTLGPAATEAP